MQKTIVGGTVLGVIILVGIGMIYALRVPRTVPKTYLADKGPNFIDVYCLPCEDAGGLRNALPTNVVDATLLHVRLTPPSHRKSGESMSIK